MIAWVKIEVPHALPIRLHVSIMLGIGDRFVHAGGYPVTHPQAISRTRPAPTIAALHRPGSNNTLQSGEIFQKIRGVHNAVRGFGHPGGELAGADEALRGEDGAKVRDQRLLRGRRKASSSTDFQPLDPCSPSPLIRQRPQDQRGEPRAQACVRCARATVVCESAAAGKVGRIIHHAHHLDVVEISDVAEVGPGGAQSTPSRLTSRRPS